MHQLKQKGLLKASTNAYCRGQVILEDLCGLLLRFRMKTIGLASDIEKAFLHVGLHVADRDVTRSLWLTDIRKPVQRQLTSLQIRKTTFWNHFKPVSTCHYNYT